MLLTRNAKNARMANFRDLRRLNARSRRLQLFHVRTMTSTNQKVKKIVLNALNIKLELLIAAIVTIPSARMLKESVSLKMVNVSYAKNNILLLMIERLVSNLSAKEA